MCCRVWCRLCGHPSPVTSETWVVWGVFWTGLHVEKAARKPKPTVGCPEDIMKWQAGTMWRCWLSSHHPTPWSSLLPFCPSPVTTPNLNSSMQGPSGMAFRDGALPPSFPPSNALSSLLPVPHAAPTPAPMSCSSCIQLLHWSVLTPL